MAKSFSELEGLENEGPNLMLVDALNLAFRYKHKKQRNFASDYLRTVNSLAKSYSAGKVIICVDGRGGSSYRKGLYPEYKGNRVNKDESPEEKQEFLDFISDFNDAVEFCKINHPVIRFDGVEADDIIAYILLEEEEATHRWIISSDRDFDQLIDERTSRFSYVTRKEICLDNFYETYGCTPEQYTSVKALQGDMGDNIMGIPSVGPKRAVGLVREYGSALDLWEALPLAGSSKVIQNINEFGDKIILNLELMDLTHCVDALSKEQQDEILEIVSG